MEWSGIELSEVEWGGFGRDGPRSHMFLDSGGFLEARSAHGSGRSIGGLPTWAGGLAKFDVQCTILLCFLEWRRHGKRENPGATHVFQEMYVSSVHVSKLLLAWWYML